MAKTEMLLVNAVGEMGQLGTAQRIGGSSGGGGSVTPGSIVTATGQMSDAQKAGTRENLGAGTMNPPDVVDLASTSPEIEPEDNTVYRCREMTSLTVTNPPSTGAYSIVFTSGSTATSTTFPATILGLESFAAEANTLYEINVLDNRAVVGSWAVSA
jgi:hypothetical protein